MTRSLFLACFFCLLLCHTLLSAPLSSRIDSLFQKWDKQTSPGCAVAVVHHGDIIFSNAYGMADLEHQVPLTIDSRFNLGSVSKQFTAACIMLLVDRGKLSLNDDVHKYLPELPDYGAPLQIQHLIHHTSGLSDTDWMSILAGLDQYASEQKITDLIFRQQKLAFTPGERHHYSNTNYHLLGLIVEKVTGQELADFMSEQLFAPLGMTNTQLLKTNKEIVPNRACGYSETENGFQRETLGPVNSSGASDIYTTVGDMVKWDQNFYSQTVGGSNFRQRMQTKATLNSGETHIYAGGLFVGEYRGVPSIGHGGMTYGYKSEYQRYPDQDFSVIVLSNIQSTNTLELCYHIADIVLEKDLQPLDEKETKAPQTFQAISVAPETLEQYVGEYELVPGFILKISRREQHLIGQATGQPEFELFAAGPDSFFLKVVDAQGVFQRNTGGEVTALKWHQGGQTLVGNKLEAAKPDAAALQPYCGLYFSKELNVVYRIHLQESELFVDGPTPPDFINLSIPLVRQDKDRFQLFVVQFDFQRGENLAVNGFTIKIPDEVSEKQFFRIPL